MTKVDISAPWGNELFKCVYILEKPNKYFGVIFGIIYYSRSLKVLLVTTHTMSSRMTSQVGEIISWWIHFSSLCGPVRFGPLKIYTVFSCSQVITKASVALRVEGKDLGISGPGFLCRIPAKSVNVWSSTFHWRFRECIVLYFFRNSFLAFSWAFLFYIAVSACNFAPLLLSLLF